MSGGSDSGRITLQTLADHLGVSRTTVSNAYNRPDQLSDELRDRILAAAAELGYQGPAAAARMLRTGRAGAIGVLFTEDLRFVFDDPNTARFLHGVAETSALAQTGLMLLPVPAGVDVADTAIPNVAVDGVIAFSVPEGHPALDALLARRAPTVIVDQPDLGATTSFVGVDDRAGARAAAQHLLDLGHRRIGVLLPRPPVGDRPGPVATARLDELDLRVGRARLAGYRDALAGAGLDPDGLVVWAAESLGIDAGREAATDFLISRPELTGVLCYADQLAIGAAQAAGSIGRSVPDDLSIVGFDDVPRAATWDPPLTTIHQPLVDKGRAAAELLLSEIDDGIRRRVDLPVGLLVRSSSAPPPHRT
ncbi:MAG: LacI family DNA-binding transcriptional regulator [Actinomycetota bacterium]